MRVASTRKLAYSHTRALLKMNDFEWRTEEDEPWPEKLRPPAQPEAGPRVRPLALVALLLAATAVILVMRQARQQVTVVESTAADDVRHAFYLVQQAAERGDSELVTSLLDRSDAFWFAAQQEIVEQGVFGDRSFAGLAPHAAGLEIIDVTLSPDFTAAELLWRRTYTVDVGAGASGSATFEHVDFYRFREGRWLLAPPPPDFWGAWQMSKGQFLTLVYPQRDDAIGRRLATDLDEMMARLCDQFEGAAQCRPGGPVQLRLGKEVNRLLHMALRSNTSMSGASTAGPIRQIDLPAPTLLGHPVDESGYQALYAAYGRYLARLITTHIVNRQHGLDAHQRLLVVEKLLLESGLLTWPPAAAVAAQAPQTALPAPAPQLAVFCTSATGQGNDLHRYIPGTGDWQPGLMGEDLYLMVPVAGGRAVALAGQPLVAGERRQRLNLYSNQGTRVLLDRSRGADAGQSRPYARVTAPTDSRLLIWIPDESTASFWQWLDVDDCLAGDCGLSRAGDYLQWVQWAPGAAHTLFSSVNEHRSQLALGDGQGLLLRELDLQQATWLSAEQYAGVYGRFRNFVERQTLASGAAALGSVSAEEPHILLTAVDLLATVPAEEWPRQFDVTSVQAVPGRPDLLLIQASGQTFETGSGPGGFWHRRYLFLADTAGGARLLWSGTILSTFVFSPDGRRLAWITDDGDRHLAIYDLEQNDLHTVDIGPEPFFELMSWPSIHWSADGRWLVVTHDSLLYLVAPEYGYRQIVIPEAPGCTQAAWIE
jgi:hypothetical protein